MEGSFAAIAIGGPVNVMPFNSPHPQKFIREGHMQRLPLSKDGGERVQTVKAQAL